MATMAFYDGRSSGRLGAPESHNPYGADDPRYAEWKSGYEEGRWVLRASDIELFQALKRLRNSMVKLDRLPGGFPEYWH